jgi:hypothetical protein
LDVRGFYDAFAPWYHLVYPDWEASIARQGQALASLLASELGSLPHNVLDAAVGIGMELTRFRGHPMVWGKGPSTMPKSHRPYPPQLRQRIIDLVRKGRTPEELARQFEPSARFGSMILPW